MGRAGLGKQAGNREPLLARVTLVPGVVPPVVSIAIRLDESGDVRAIVECGDGRLLRVRRWVWVMPPDGEPSVMSSAEP